MVFFTIIGILAVVFLLYKLLAMLCRIIYPYVIARPKNLETLAGKGTWAMVTGCTDGIGRAYAEELAGKGISLVLVSRSAQKLAHMEAEFKRRFAKPDYLTIPFDFSESTVDQYRHRLLQPIKHLEIGILVNNVGASLSHPQRFHDSEDGLERMAEIININMMPLTLLSAFVLDQMVKRGRGVIVNISSIAAYAPCYYLAIYGATKAYVNSLSAALRQEYARPKGVIIQTICPGAVITNMSRMVSEGKNSSFFMPSAQNFARSAVRTIGNVSETCGCMGHQIQTEIMFRLLPGFLRDFLFRKKIDSVRKDWLNKAPVETP